MHVFLSMVKYNLLTYLLTDAQVINISKMKWILKLSDDTERTKNETTDMKRLDIRTVSKENSNELLKVYYYKNAKMK